ncbi:MAG: metal-dependent transcriptional regulator [Clostridiales bacterium]|nr:metal-dependent transcriptional regulator [Clostridiales bacterium]
MAVSEAIENYLETIYILSRQQNEVHAIDICTYLSYSRPTVSIVLRQMRENGLVTVNEDNHIHLTEEGLAIASRIYERHTVLSDMLMSLGVKQETALRDACKIEHDLSDETFEAIKRHARRMKKEKKGAITE